MPELKELVTNHLPSVVKDMTSLPAFAGEEEVDLYIHFLLSACNIIYTKMALSHRLCFDLECRHAYGNKQTVVCRHHFRNHAE